jgi:hypothetical protein
MIYSGDIYNFVLSLTHTDGTTPNVTVTPLITIIQLSTNLPVATIQTMTVITGTAVAYSYAWNTVGVSDGDYAAVVSYAVDGTTINNRYLERVHVGDSRVTGPVALDATVAHDATVAKDSTVAHITDLGAIDPANSATILAIKAKTDTLPVNPASQDTLNTALALINDIHDVSMGTWTIDKTQNPKILSLHRLDGSVLVSFQVTEDSNSAARTKI